MYFSTKHENKYLHSLIIPQGFGYDCYRKTKVGKTMMTPPTLMQDSVLLQAAELSNHQELSFYLDSPKV